MTDLDSFRTETRDWLEANCPASMRTRPNAEDVVWGGRNQSFTNPDAKDWLTAMGDKGWTCPTWPTEYGGGGLSHEEDKILQQELQRIKARPALMSFGLTMLGPVLLEVGTEEQKAEHLPKIAKGEIRWCQGYSEPGAGSDLASLQTKAVVDGDNYIINGSKIWTSFAHLSDWIYCLVRTDSNAPKHEGISFVLFDMASPGVTASPIQLISGASQFCETFFDDVAVPRKNLVGTENEGWKVAKRLLQYERNMVAGMGSGGSGRNPQYALENQAKHYLGEVDGKIQDTKIRADVAQFKMNSAAFKLTLQRAGEESHFASAPSPASSMFKLYGTELNKAKSETMMDMMGSQALGWDGNGFSDYELGTTKSWLRSKANSIEGGTTEVQLNVIAKRVLGLPD